MHKTKQKPKYFSWPHYKNKVNFSELVLVDLFLMIFKTPTLFCRLAGDCTVKG